MLPASTFLLVFALAQTPTPPQAPGEKVGDDPLLAPVPSAPVVVNDWADALGRVREHSSDLRRAVAQVEAASGRTRVALAGLLPSIDGGASVQYDLVRRGAPPLNTGGGTTGGQVGGEGLNPTVPLGVLTARAEVPLLDLSAWSARDSAASQERAAALSLDDAERRITGALATALLNVLTAERAVEVQQASLRLALERQSLARRAFSLGAANRIDVVRTEQDTTRARNEVVGGKEQLRRAREALGLVLGIGQPVGVAPTLKLDGATQLLDRCQKIEQLGDRPDLLAAQAQLDAAESAVSEATRRYLPRLSAQSQATGLTVDPGPVRVPTWSISAVLTIPIWDGGARGGVVQEQRAQQTIQQEALAAATRNAQIEIGQARRGIEVAERQLALAVDERRLATENDRLTRRSFEVGLGTSLELVQSATDLRQAELNVTVREFELVQARIGALIAEARCDVW